MKRICYISLGSNLGDKLKNLNSAIDLISRSTEIDLIKSSKIYKSKALSIDGLEHPDYLNMAVKIRTDFSPQELLLLCKSIEKDLGRSVGTRWSDRIIDLDILLYGDEIIDDNSLIIPHPELRKRSFVIQPLCDIDPTIKIPPDMMSVGEISIGLEVLKCLE